MVNVVGVALGICVVLLLGEAHAQELFPCTGCFCDPTWDKAELQVTNNTVFGQSFNKQTLKNETLLLNIYEPPASDKRTRRPAMVVIHGGGFAFNDKDTPWYVDVAKYFGAHGFVTVSINYRLEHDMALVGTDADEANFSAANYDAMLDTRAAIRWLVKSSDTLRIDPHRIAAFGGSAGGCDVAFLTAVPGEGDSGNPGFPSNITAGVSLSGILVPSARGNITASDPPYINFHGTADPGVPPQWAKDTKEAMDKAGAVNDLVFFEGEGHVPFVQLFVNHTHDLMGWLTMHMDLAAAQCPPGTLAQTFIA